MFHYEMGEVERWEEIADGEEWTKTKCILNAMSGIYLSKITRENLPTWEKRVRAVEGAGMVLTTYRGKPHALPMEWVERRVGLWSNERNVSDREFSSLLKEWKKNHAK